VRQENPALATARQGVAQRIRHAIVGRRGVPGGLALDLAVLERMDHAKSDDGEERAMRELKEDVELLHALWGVNEVDLTASPRRFGGLLRRFRQIVQGSLPALVHRQAEFNAANARAVSALRNRTIRQDALIEQIREGVLHVLKPTMERQVEGLLELERVVRRFEADQLTASRASLDVDQAALMERFRGSEDEIRERQRPYVDLFRDSDDVLDLGCGRGEFLELLAEAGVAARGVDLDPAMVERCREKGLDVDERDALDALAAAEPGSLGGLFAAQLVEHLDPPALVRLVRRAFVVLRPGAPLLLETMNPRSLIALAAFYIDLTHVRPYDPDTLRWLVEDTGFVNADVQYSLAPERPAPTDEAVAQLDAHVFAPQAFAVTAAKPSS
jgi:SAM-dependent methyltransferase